MPFFRPALLLVLALPGLADAQRSRDSDRGNRRPVVIREDAPPEFRTKDLENLNPARMALDDKKTLNLSADQIRQLDSIARAFNLSAKAFGTAVESFQNVLNRTRRNAQNEARDRAMRRPRERPASPKDSSDRARNDSIDVAKSDKEWERAMGARNGLNATLLAIRVEYDAYIAATNTVLNDEQRAKVGPSVESASNELTMRLHWAALR